jgi:hypothetical protein
VRRTVGAVGGVRCSALYIVKRDRASARRACVDMYKSGEHTVRKAMNHSTDQ